jgi:hypothetical protein
MRQMQQQQQVKVEIPVDKIDEFINKCCEKYDESLYSLAMELQNSLQGVGLPYISMPQAQVYPLVLQRLKERLDKGEK